jgi:hypothetical protein
MKYAVEMGSSVMIYIPSFIKTRLGNQKLRWGNSQRHRQDNDCMSLLSESRLEIYLTTRMNFLRSLLKIGLKINSTEWNTNIYAIRTMEVPLFRLP